MSSFSLEDYGVIGNFSSAVLINRVASIDWACLPYLDSPSHFGAILDDVQGGHFQISPQGDFRSEQRYHQRTLVLETLFETPFGRGVITDWMPLENSQSNEPLIYRQIDMVEGRINWMLDCNPRFDYASTPCEVEFHGEREAEGRHLAMSKAWSSNRVLFRGNQAGQIAQLFSSIPLKFNIHRNSAEARFSLSSGESVMFAWAWGRRTETPPFQSFQETLEQWRKLSHSCPASSCVFAGPWHDAITRSGLFLKLLIAPYSGSIAEAVTTSIPGIVSPYDNSSRKNASSEQNLSRTWDCRYAWINHGVMAMQALIALGYRNEAKNHFCWLSEIIMRDGIERLQPVYTLDGGRMLVERELDHLKGFHGARPVRVGNESSGKFHLDIYGQLMLAADFYFREWGCLPDGLWRELVNIADLVCQAWRRPDYGPWQSRSKPEHYVSSKVMCWSALNTAISMASKLKEEVPPRWLEEIKILHRTICDQGFNSALGSFVRAFGDSSLDASCLWIALTGFLPLDDHRVIGTLDAVMEGLSEGVLTRRYRVDDGIAGKDGPHLQSSFLLVSVLALYGRADEASDRLAELCTFATNLGIFGEQVNPDIQETSGNFPSATACVSLINAALYVGAARGRQISSHLIGLQSASLHKKGRAA